MRLNEIRYDAGLPIDGYGPGFFRVGGKVHQGPLLVLPDGAQAWAGLDDSGPLIAAAARIDVLFLGTGAEIAHPPGALRAALDAAGVGVEPMATPAACRTYNILLSEGRRIGAALLPV